MSNSISGARVIFQINNAPVLFANAVSYEVNHNLEPFYHLDSVAPAEYYETTYEVTLTCNLFRVPYKSAMSQGLIPKLNDIVIQPELKAVMLDQITLQPIFTVERIKCTSESFDVDARNLAKTTLTFKGIRLISDNNF